MWGSNDNNKLKTAKVETIIGPNTELVGDLTFRGGLHVDGTIKGNVIADATSDSILILSKDGKIEGEVRVPNVLLDGLVNGNVHAEERVELANHARIEGNVYYNLLEMEMGATINGNLVHQAKREKPLLEYRDPANKKDQKDQKS
ncbi:MAG: polymer-forming cytoskeletal protein [Gammaproteobacteria bacterium]|nr:polymer-forming cytoskeletal protein [Gammaproteobacteria bacterium]